MNTNSKQKTCTDDDPAHEEARPDRIHRICAAAEARTSALLERLGVCRPNPCRSPEPPARCRPLAPLRHWRIAPLFVDPPTDAGALKARTPRSPETVFELLQDLLHLKRSVSTSDSFSSVDTQTPRELRDIPLITTPDEVVPPQTAFIPTPPPPRITPQPRRRKSFIPVLIQRFLKKPGKEAASLQRAELQREPLRKPKLFRRSSVAPLPRRAAAPQRTLLVRPPQPDPPKTERAGAGAAAGATKTPKLKKPALHRPQPKEELKPLPYPVQSLSLVLQHLSQDDWEKKVEVLGLVRALAQHHPDTLMVKLHEVCLAVTNEIKNLRSSVACAAIDTLGSLYTHLQKDMDVEVERSGRALLLRIAQASASRFVQQQVNLALEAMVKNCSPGRVLTALLNTGLSHLSAAVRTSAAQQLHLLVEEMGADAVLAAGARFTSCFLLALSKMCLDAAATVRSIISVSRPHGHVVLQQLSLHKDFKKLWDKTVGESERLALQKVLQKGKRMS